MSSGKEVEKLAKRKLHQAFAAFLDPTARKRALALLNQAASEPDDERWGSLLDEVLGLHASTSERQGSVAALWEVVRAAAPRVDSILDLGCGLAPASLPHTGLPFDVAYRGVDLDVDLCRAQQAALRPRWPFVEVVAGEIRSGGPWPAADVVMLCKLLPTLERQQAGAAEALLASLDAGLIVATFPTRSLSGLQRGMTERYAALAERVLPRGRSIVVGDELVRLSG